MTENDDLPVFDDVEGEELIRSVTAPPTEPRDVTISVAEKVSNGGGDA